MKSQASRNATPYLFTEAIPFGAADGRAFQSECPPDKKIKVENLFAFRRGRGDVHVSFLLLCLACFFTAFFWTETGWDRRKLPDELGPYIAYQFGFTELEGRIPRLGTILKQSWVAPMLCLLVLVPAAIWNFYSSFKNHQWRKRFLLPTDPRFEFSKYIAALEFVAYFIIYTILVPILGYLLSTLGLGSFLVWRLGYRTKRWASIGLASSFAAVLIFRTILQIKTPGSIWLYDQLPSTMRAFMLTYF